MSEFGTKIKKHREKMNLSQDQLAEMVGVTRRTIVSYETGGKKPHSSRMQEIAKVLCVTEHYLRNDDCENEIEGIEEEPYVQEARKRYGSKGAAEMSSLLKQNETLFAGGALSQEQKDMFFEAVSRAYYMNKEKAKEKFGRKKEQQ